MKNYLFISILSILLFSCKEKPLVIPDNILTKDKMVGVLIDVHLLEAIISGKNISRDSSILLYSLYEKNLFRKHNITDSIYRKSFEFYSNQPDLINTIYLQVVDSLSLREGQNRF
ncbi:MAG TPA: DUF4296 domain-containing protein [Cytophagaceae bacterium]|jgi:hypothetical protein|nr:DUF4296 domain-containing protein [Cytophagaceae bacterium]